MQDFPSIFLFLRIPPPSPSGKNNLLESFIAIFSPFEIKSEKRIKDELVYTWFKIKKKEESVPSLKGKKDGNKVKKLSIVENWVGSVCVRGERSREKKRKENSQENKNQCYIFNAISLSPSPPFSFSFSSVSVVARQNLLKD